MPFHFLFKFSISGTCFSTRGAPDPAEIIGAGEGNSLTITTTHDTGNTFDEKLVDLSLFGMTGLSFAVVNDWITVAEAMESRSQSVNPGLLGT
jgi:hypothetical protein